MTKQTINLGTPPEGKDGDTARAANVKVNANFTELYLRARGKLSKSIAGAAGIVALTEAEALNGFIDLTGVITGNREVTVDASWTQAWLVRNSSSGAYSVTYRTAGGTGVVVGPGATAVLYSDGVNIVDPIGLASAVTAAVSAALAVERAPEVGKIQFYPRTTAPTGYLKANGAAVLVASYPALTAAIYCGDALNATAFSCYRCDNADGTGRNIAGQYLRLPDLRGEFLRAWDDGRGIDVSRALFSFQADEYRSHNHTAPVAANGGGAASFAAGASAATTIYNLNSSGGSETRPRNIALLAVIRAF